MELLDGPQFLLLYVVVCSATVTFAAWFVRSKDTSTAGAPEPIGNDLNPYAIAYLRGGANELVRYIVFELTRDRLLEVVPSKKKHKPARIVRTSATHGAQSALAKMVYDYFETPHTAQELFASSIPQQVESAFEPARGELVSRRLLTGDEMTSASRTMRVNGCLIVDGLFLARLWYAIVMHHRNIFFMFVVAGISTIVLLLLTKAPRVSKRGRQYLESLRASLPVSNDPAAIASPVFGLAVAAAGIAVLAGTPYAALGDTFKRQLASGASSSSGCGSSGCGGGGCGGGGCGG